MVNINFVGDVALFREFEAQKVDPFSKISLPQSSFNVANFEFPVVDPGMKKRFYDVDDNYGVSSTFLKSLNLSKFDLYSLANNHVADFGLEGMEATASLLRSQGSKVFGFGGRGFNTESVVIEGISFLFVAFVKMGRWSRGAEEIGPDPYCVAELCALIKQEARKFDHIIVFPHWGTELVDSPDPADVINARLFIESGASCVIGHHPHVAQGLELYGDGLISFSLGSFIYIPEFEKGNVDLSPDRDVSICLSVEFSKDGIIDYVPYKYVLSKDEMIPVCVGDYRSESKFLMLCNAIGDQAYYARKIRSVLLRREIFSFLERFKENPIKTIFYYFKYLEFRHVKKIFGKS